MLRLSVCRVPLEIQYMSVMLDAELCLQKLRGFVACPNSFGTSPFA